MSLQVTLRAYIGQNDGLLHRMDTNVTYDMSGMQAAAGTESAPPVLTSVTGSTVFSNFNEPVTITAPTLGT